MSFKVDWSLPRLMQALHKRVEQDLKTAREALGHPVAKGDGSEAVWLRFSQNTCRNAMP